MDFEKIKSATLTDLPEELDDKKLVKADSELKKAQKPMKDSADAFLNEVKAVRVKAGDLKGEILQFVKINEDPIKRRAADKFHELLGSYRDDMRGK